MATVIATPSGTPIFHEASENGYSTLPNIATMSDGTMVVAWTQYSDEIREVYAQRLNADGTPIGDAFMVNTTTQYDQRQPVVTPLSNGNFVITWQSLAQDNFIENTDPFRVDQYVEQYGVYQRIFAADGSPLSGEELVNTIVDGRQLDHLVHVMPDGGYYTTWRSFNYISSNGQGEFVFGQRYDDNGDRVGGNVELPANFHVRPIVLTNGNIAFAWRDPGENFNDIRITVMTPNGNSLNDFSVRGGSVAPSLSYVELTALPDGNIFVAMSYRDTDGFGPRDIAGIVYAPNGTIVVNTFPIHEEVGTDLAVYEVVTLQNGNVLVTYSGRYSNDYYGIVVTQDGTVLSDPIRLSTIGPDSDRGYITALDGGGFAIVYPTSDGTIVTRVYDIDFNVTATQLTSNSDTYVETDNSGAVIFGLDGNDSITGGAGRDRILGGDGIDRIDGGAGNDAIYGGLANDNLAGGDGDDTLEGNGNNDALFGGAGSDHLDGGLGHDNLYGGEGNDILTGQFGRDTFYGDDGDDRIHLGAEGDFDPNAHFLAYGGEGDDHIVAFGLGHTIFGDAGDDYIYAEATGDFFGGTGDDYIYASTGNIYGGDGQDSFTSAGIITVDMTTGVWSTGEVGSRRFYDISDIETFHFDPNFNGFNWDLTWSFIGSAASETVTYSWGFFTGSGGDGDDTFIALNSDNRDINDIVPSRTTIDAGAGDDTIFGGTSLDTLTGGSGNDLIDGGHFPDFIFGGLGDDDLYGGTGKDTIDGGKGNDFIDGGNGQDIVMLSGPMGDYTITVSGDGYVIQGPDGTDYIENIEFAIFGDGTKASVDSGGFTVIDQLPFNDAPSQTRPLDNHVSAQGGAFQFAIPAGTYVDPDTNLRYDAREMDRNSLPGWLDFDARTQTFSGTPPANYSGTITIRVTGFDDGVLGQSVSDTFTFTITPTGTAVVTGSNEAGGIMTGGTMRDTLNGGVGDDVIYGRQGNDVLTDSGGQNQIWGDGGHDTITLTSGQNTVFGGSGHDKIDGGRFKDVINGGGGADEITGGGGADVIQGGGGSDLLFGNNGNDRISGDNMSDLIYGGNGNDKIYGGNGADKIYGEGKADQLYGGGKADQLYGGGGEDKLYGDGGFDKLLGGNRADKLDGGAGRDVLTGGAGADDFIFDDGDSSTANTKRDVITDFGKGADHIDLRLMDADRGTNSDDAFVFSGTSARAHGVWYEVEGSNVVVYGDQNGDGKADFEIALLNVSSLSASDFLL